MTNNDLNKKIAAATMWSSLTQIVAKLIPPITNMILARLLTPEMFGVVATFSIIISFAEIFTDAGFQKYIIQHEFEDDESLYESVNVAFWTNFILSTIIWFVIARFCDEIAKLVGSEGYGFGIAVACSAIPLTAFSSIQNAVFKRNFDFKTTFKIRMFNSLLPLFTTVPLAIVLHNYWALVIGTLVRQFSDAILLTIFSPWKPQFRYSVAKLKEMLSFSLWTFVEQISIWFTVNIDVFFVSFFMNTYYLGIYKTTMITLSSIFSIISSATMPVLFSALSRVQNDNIEFRRVFFKFQHLVAIIVLPLGVGCFIFRDLITKILLGNQWLEATEFMGLWALALSLSMIFSYFNSEAIRSKGQPKLSLLAQCIQILFLIIVLFISKDYGFRAVCVSRSMVCFVLIIVTTIIVHKRFEINFILALKNNFPMLICAICMGICGGVLKSLNDFLLWQFLCVGICILIYFSLLFFLFPKIKDEILNIDLVARVLKRLTRKRFTP